MEQKLLTPQQVWQDYDPSEGLDSLLAERTENGNAVTETYFFTALTAPDGAVRVSVKVYSPKESVPDRAVIFIHEYRKNAQQAVVDDLVKEGYAVLIPDFSGIDEKHRTVFPQSLSYGNIAEAGNHLTMVCPTAKETCNYLYARIIKRTAVFAAKQLGIDNIAVLAVGDGVEAAMQAAANDESLAALVCIESAGYKEYLKFNKYGAKTEMTIDHAMLCWLTGVASVAYVKHIKSPVLIAVSSNGKRADIDRLSNLLALFREGQANIMISPLCRGNISRETYDSVKVWLDGAFNGNHLPGNPSISNNVSEKTLYAEVKADSCKDIKEVNIYYSTGEYNHVMRNWIKVRGEAVDTHEFIARMDVYDNEEPLFSFCEVIYGDGMRLSSDVEYTDLKGADIKEIPHKKSRIIYEGAMGTGSFSEQLDTDIIMEGTLCAAATPKGLKGVYSGKGSLINYEIGDLEEYSQDKILQIDVYTETEQYVDIVLFKKEGEEFLTYTARSWVTATPGFFSGLRFTPDAFKTEGYMPLEGWEKIKAVKIATPKVIIGKMLFI